LIGLAISISGIIGANQIVLLLAPGLNEAAYGLAVRLTRILFLGSLFVGPAGVMRAYLNAHSYFNVPAMFELIRGLVTIATILITSQHMGIESVALGYVAGAGFQFIVLTTAVLVQIGFDFRWVLRLALIKSTRAHRLFLVHIGNFVIVQSVMILQRVIGSFLPEGSISAISYGHRMASVVGTLLFSGVEVVSLSSLAADFAKGMAVSLQRAKDTLHIGLRLGLILGFPVATGIFILSYPITQVLFERGAFDYSDTLLAAPVLGLFALSIPFYGHWLILVNYLFAANRPRMILVLSTVFAATNLILAVPLSRLFGAVGLAVTYVGGFVAMYGFSFGLIRDELKPYWRTMLGLAGKAMGASMAMGLVLLEVSQNLTRLLQALSDLPDGVTLFFSMLIAGVAGISIYLWVILLLRVEEATELKKYIKGRWSARLGSSIQ
jgi:putative peptidoglycan lipid II flippase